MSIFSEFKDFAIKGNAIDMAVGIVIGAAFGKVISSLVSDVIMPPIGKLIGSVDFSNLFLNLGDVHYTTLAAAKVAGASTLNYGVFIQTCVDFFIVALAIFMAVKGINAMRRKQEQKTNEPVKPSQEVLLLQEIRDSLQKR